MNLLPWTKRQPTDTVTVSCMLLPLHQILAFAVCLIWLIVLSAALSGGQPSVLGILAQVSLGCLVIVLAIRLKVELTPAGLIAKNSMHRQSLFERSDRPWDDLHSVRLRKVASPAAILDRLKYAREGRLCKESAASKALRLLGKGWMQQGFIMLDFKSGGTMAMPIAGLSAESLEELCLALSRWANPMSMNPDVLSLQRNILMGQELTFEPTYTKMWEESLRDRFEATNFVPLLGGHELRDGEYKILLLMACGGMSSIYLARDCRGKRCVVKEMAVPLGDDPEARARLEEMFSREAKFLSNVNHPSVVKVLDHFVETGKHYLVLEFIPGLTLRQHVQLSGPFSETEVIRMARQIADILDHLHGLAPAVVHRDLTPDNLIVREPERSIALIDLGAATEFAGKVTGTLIGKQCYIPPEQFQGYACPQSDLYALGATMFFCLTGEDPTPLTESRPRQIMPNISQKLDDLVACATAMDTDKRVHSANDFLRKLQELSGDVQRAV